MSEHLLAYKNGIGRLIGMLSSIGHDMSAMFFIKYGLMCIQWYWCYGGRAEAKVAMASSGRNSVVEKDAVVKDGPRVEE